MTARRGYPKGQLRHAGRSRDPHIDEIAVQRACHGDPVELTVAERGEAIRRLTRQGLSARAISERLRMAARTVGRHRNGWIKYGYPQAVDNVGEINVDSGRHGTVAA